mgnify:CR=1 FL=1
MEEEEKMKITHPWVVIHQENGNGPILTMLSGPKGATVNHFALCAADLIRHIAVSYEVSSESVTELVMKEIQNPTTDISRVMDL